MLQYPPRGFRSFGLQRLLRELTTHRMLMMKFDIGNDRNGTALEAVEAILEIDELDGIYFGPSDLGLAMGIGSNAWPSPAMRDAISHVLEAAKSRGKYSGVFASSPEMAQSMAAQGFDLVTPGNDAHMLKAGANQRIEAVRGAWTANRSRSINP
uniref:HpcH/HpaI aldolase/citrate lyase domain-containing protein n=1 Tax=Curvibacter symbiont subsp. Hydra magnipapillata TaxID=667019 RepID=C9YBM0_CURXX|nr:hypothetical protein Csp_A15210 [Curvibacter putative symbiont of Hydra magnipapillata]